MSTSLETIEFRPLVIPASIDADDAADFRAMTDVRNAVYRHVAGHDDHAMSAAELLPNYRPEPYEIRMSWLVLDDGRPVGRVGIDIPIETESRVAYMLIELLPDVWGRGIGTRALELVEGVARDHGRTVLQSWAEHPDRPGPRLEPPTGFGSIPADDPGARFYVRHGFTLEQIERNSAFDLRAPFDEVDRLLEQARAASAGYRLVSGQGATPPGVAGGFAWGEGRGGAGVSPRPMRFGGRGWGARAVAPGAHGGR